MCLYSYVSNSEKTRYWFYTKTFFLIISFSDPSRGAEVSGVSLTTLYRIIGRRARIQVLFFSTGLSLINYYLRSYAKRKMYRFTMISFVLFFFCIYVTKLSNRKNGPGVSSSISVDQKCYLVGNLEWTRARKTYLNIE